MLSRPTRVFARPGANGRESMPPDLAFHLPTMASIAELLNQIRKGEIDAETVTRTYLQAIRERDRSIRAFLHVDETAALEKARAVDQKRQRGECLGPSARLPLRRRRRQTDIRSCLALRPDRVRLVVGPSRRLRSHRVGRGPAARNNRRPRSARQY